MMLPDAFKGPLEKLGGKWDGQVVASRSWPISFFSEGPPPVAVAFLKSMKKRAFFEELVKLSDIKKVLDARPVLVTRHNTIDAEGVQLATGFGIFVVLEGDSKNFEAALNGEDVSDVNTSTKERLLVKKSRSASKECRTLELDLLSKKWMTLRELEEQLRWRFEACTIRSQARSLQRGGKACVCGRTETGEGLLGTPDGIYKIRSDLSAPTVKKALSMQILRLIEVEAKPLDYKEISEKLGVRAHVATAALRALAKKGLVEKRGSKWAPKARI